MKKRFGARFSELRKEKGLTQEQVAERLNVSSQAVSKWENDLSYPDVELLVEIANLFDTSVDDLLGSKKQVETQVVPSESRKDASQMIFKIVVHSGDGDKVKINIPFMLLKVGLELGAHPKISGYEALKNIDFEQIISMVESGVIGKLVEVESADGDTVEIYVE